MKNSPNLNSHEKQKTKKNEKSLQSIDFIAMAQMLKLYEKYFKSATIKVLKKAIINSLETNIKKEIISKEIEHIKEKK